ncbi:P63C domain-containing protein [Acetobacter pasteurianus]|uniref:P63C domain-containing protein n=1 Tax=Acetobacter pasteurianus TaxID=438 RepID=UPI001F368D37|nr:P63C domain-containing protein [Acetobacter pasteurianus]QHM92571.2 P63C domain-containing protein [Acetobacter pasteurianus]
MTADIIPFKIERQDDGELRISDVELSKHLGYSSVRAFRNAIRKNIDDIKELDFCTTAMQKSSGGRPEKIYWLTERQAVHMTYRADTPEARQIAILLTKAFVALRRKTERHLPLPEFFRLQLINDQVRQWQREYPATFFIELHRVLGLRRPAIGNHSNCSHFINRYVYQFLFGALGLDAIRGANPADEEHVRAHKHHQVLREKHMPRLRQHIDKVGALLANAVSISHFDDMFNRSFPSMDTQIGFMFAETPLLAISRTPAQEAAR